MVCVLDEGGVVCYCTHAVLKFEPLTTSDGWGVGCSIYSEMHIENSSPLA